MNILDVHTHSLGLQYRKKSGRKIKTMAVLIHIPGNWESVFILGKEPGRMWGMKRKTVHFFCSFFHFLRVSHCLSHPQLLNIQLKKSKAIHGSTDHPQSQPLQQAITHMEAPGETAGTHPCSKELCFRKKLTDRFTVFHIFNFEEFTPPPKGLQSRGW